jgi:hypothetical protein
MKIEEGKYYIGKYTDYKGDEITYLVYVHKIFQGLDGNNKYVTYDNIDSYNVSKDIYEFDHTVIRQLSDFFTPAGKITPDQQEFKDAVKMAVKSQKFKKELDNL